jgi:hypothetical protein
MDDFIEHSNCNLLKNCCWVKGNTKGIHIYTRVTNMIEYSNQVDVFKTFKGDFIHSKNNMWEKIDKTIHNYNGSIVTIYPNPMKDELWIEMYNSAALKLEIRIVDMSGRILKHINTDQAKGNHKISIPVNDLNAGIYAVQIIENGKLTSTSKINK